MNGLRKGFFLTCMGIFSALQLLAIDTLRVNNSGSSNSILVENISWRYATNGELVEWKNLQKNILNEFLQAELLIIHQSPIDQGYIWSFPKVGQLEIYMRDSLLKTGSLLELNQRSQPSSNNAIRLQLFRNDTVYVKLRMRVGYSVYYPKGESIFFQTRYSFEEKDRKRLFWQGIFLGVIFVMALYNFLIWWAVRDHSFFHYVVSIVSIGLYFSFYYGFGIEYLWPHSPRWDTFSYTLLVPATGIARLLFTRTYLHVINLHPYLQKLGRLLLWLSGSMFLIGLGGYIFDIDYLSSLIDLIGITGTFILIYMLVAGFYAYYVKKYRPAKYFIWANLVLVVGAILFILKEMHLIQDNFFTRYIVQFGVMIQVLVFALGLASRLNQTQEELTKETLEKERLAVEIEREKKEMSERQNEELQKRVEKQTWILLDQNKRLADTIKNLRDSQDQLAELNKVKDKLFSIISHDLRNPLATMQSFLKLITEHHEKLSGEDRVKLMKEAQDSLDHVNQLLYNVLQWSKSQMQLLEFRPELIDVRLALEKGRRLLHLQAQLKQIEILVEVPSNLLVHADKDMLDFMIRNVINNAIKFSRKGSKILLLGFQNDHEIGICCKDEGVGMDEETLHQIEKSMLARSERGTSKERGTGLGLLIVKEFMQKHGGIVTIESQLGVGSRICLVFQN